MTWAWAKEEKASLSAWHKEWSMSSNRMANAWQPRSDTCRERSAMCLGVKKKADQVPASVMSLYLSQLAFEQRHIRGGREDDVLTRRQSVNKPQASRLGLCYESTQLSWKKEDVFVKTCASSLANITKLCCAVVPRCMCIPVCFMY